MNVVFISSISIIAADPAANRALFVDALGLPLKAADVDAEYFHSEDIEGVKHFGIWPLHQAAEACFGTSEWPADRTVPQTSIEFEVGSADAVAPAAEELRAAGYEILHETRTEPWGQTVARTLAPDGSIVGLSYAPWMHDGG